MVTQKQIDICIEVAKKYGVTKLLLFGSATEDMATARDIDFLCYGIKEYDMLMMAGMMELEAQVSVDVVPADEETPFVKLNLPRAKVVYEKGEGSEG